MAKIGGGSQQQQTKSDPWDGLKPYLIGLDGKTGIMPEAERLYKDSSPQYYQGNTYAGLNDTQKGAIDSMAAYYRSPESMAGANAGATVGNRMLDQAAGNYDLGSVYKNIGLQQSANMPGSAPMTSSGPMGTYVQSVVPPSIGGQSSAPQITIQNATAATSQPLGSSGVDWRAAINDTLKGDVSNPYLSQIADTVTRKATDNYNTNIAPQVRGGAMPPCRRVPYLYRTQPVLRFAGRATSLILRTSPRAARLVIPVVVGSSPISHPIDFTSGSAPSGALSFVGASERVPEFVPPMFPAHWATWLTPRCA